MKRRYKILVGLAAVPIVLTLGGLTYLKFADLSVHARFVERLLSDEIGRRVSIAGRFEPEIGLVSSIVVEQITLANPEWCVAPAMVQIDRLEGTIDLWSLVSGPIHIHDLRIRGVEIHLELDADGRASWDFPNAAADVVEKPLELGFPGLILDEGRLTDIRVTYTSPDRDRPLEVDIHDLDLHTADDAMIVLRLEGLFEGTALNLDGHLGPLDRLIEGFDVEHELTVRLGDVALQMNGSIGELSTLDDVTWDLDFRGPEIERVAEWLAVPSPGEGPFSVVGKVSSSPRGIRMTLDAEAGDVTVRARGNVSSFTDPRDMDLAIEAACTDLETVGEWFGVDHLPAQPLRVGGKLSRVDSRFAFENVEGRLGETEFLVNGFPGESSDLADTAVTIEVNGPNLSDFSELAEMSLPEEAFRAKGRIALGEHGLSFERFRANVGTTELELSGSLGEAPEFLGTNLDFHLRATDPTNLELLSGIGDLPPGPYEARGRIGIEQDRYVLGDFDATVGDLEIAVDGVVARGPKLVGTDVRIRLAGPDLSEVGALASVEDLPAGPFEVAGHVEVAAESYRLEDVTVRVGDIDVTLSGQVGAVDPARQGSDLTFRVRAEDLRAFETFPGVPALPSGAFSVEGRARTDDGAVRLDALEIELAGNRLRADGTVGPFPELDRTDLGLSLSGPDLAAAASLVPGGLPREWGLPADSFATSGHVRVHPDGYELREVEVRVGDAMLRADGRIGAPPDYFETDLTFDVEAPDSSLWSGLAGVDLPSSALRAGGRIEWLEFGVRVHDVRVELGDDRLDADGSIGTPPGWVGTDLTIRADGPSLARTLAFTKRPRLPDEPYLIAGRFEGTPETLSGNQLEFRVGESDLSGSFYATPGEKPRIRARFSSQKIDLAALRGKSEVNDTPESLVGGNDGTETPKSPGDESGLLIPDKPLDLRFLDTMDVDLVWDVGRLETRNRSVTDIQITVDLQDGKLKLGPVRVTNKWGETISGDLTLEPFAGGHRYDLNFTGSNWRFNLMGSGIEREQRPSMNIEARLTGHGRSVREMARTADGRIVAQVSPGKIATGSASLVGADILIELISLLNPFAKSDPYSDLECAVLAVRIDEGVAKLDPVVLRTEKLTVIGRGGVDFNTERLRFEWTMKPRKGVGLSASTITNPYIALGGTLADPRLDIKPIESVTTTSVAVATGGLSLLGRGLWNRVTAGKKVCKHALLKIAKDDEKSSEDPPRAPSP